MLTKFSLVEIEKIETYDLKEEVYDLEVEKDHSYVVNDIVVHNSSCTTRKQTGVGYPQLSAVMNCAQASESNDVPFDICADGGCVTPGDIAKAFVGGANLVMIGGMLAGTNQSGGKIITKYKFNREFTNWRDIVVRQKYMEFYGMSSDQAMNKFGGNTDYKTAEGRSMLVPYIGYAEYVIQNILGGLRSTCTYTGYDLAQLHRAQFVQTSQLHGSNFGEK